MKRSPKAGLTLMEVLVAITLLGLLSAGLLMALRVGAVAWQSAHDNLMLDRRIASANRIFHAMLEGILPALAEYRRQNFPMPFTATLFQGEPEAMRFVTAYSLERGPRSELRLMELRVFQGPRGKRVLLNDEPYGDPRFAGRVITGAVDDPGGLRLLFAPIEARPTSFIIADELEACSFSYFLQDRPEEPGAWVAVWPRVDRVPAGVSIRMTGRQDSARLRPVTITVPIRSSVREKS